MSVRTADLLRAFHWDASKSEAILPGEKNDSRTLARKQDLHNQTLAPGLKLYGI